MKDSDKFSPLASVLAALGALNTSECPQLRDILNVHIGVNVVSKKIQTISPTHDRSDGSEQDISCTLLAKSNTQKERLQ